MKKLSVFFVLALFGVFLMSAGAVHAYSYSGEWWIVSNDGEADAQWGSDWTGTELGVYKASDGSDYLKILDPVAGIADATLTISGDASSGYTLLIDTNVNSLYLGSTDTFYFSFGDPTSGGVITYNVTPDGGQNYYVSSGEAKFRAIDFANNVPLPPSAMLLGSGVVGLIGFGLKRRRSRLS